MDPKILLVFSFYPQPLEKEFLSNSRIPSLDYAAHNLQRAILHGCDDNQVDYSVINVPHLGSFPPYYKKPIVKGYKSDDSRIMSLSFINVSYIKRYHQRAKVRRGIQEWIDKTPGEKRILFYSFDFLSTIKSLKYNNDCKFFLLVADLPEYMSVDNSFLTRLNKKITKKQDLNTQLSAISGFILLAPDMIERIPVGGRPWIQVEGIYNPEDDDLVPKESSKKVFLYTGHLARRYGIGDLLVAFHNLSSPDVELHICGVGDGLEDIRKFESIDHRIKYLGTFRRQEIIRMQREATVLVNPRHSSDDYTRFSFPSKTMEYLASGTPTLMSHLTSIPKEYDSHIIYFDDESTAGMTKKMEEVLSMDSTELSELGNSARQFILSYKTPRPQVKRIVDFLRSVSGEQ